MPHLSPLNWLLSPIIFWMTIALFMSILWWSQTISFPKLTPQIVNPSSPSWNW
uniref:ATP synthase F0 subunit 8 n=1 Tax=Levensteiniella iris TaxID=2153341 RepID=A0A343W666_9ANNE|nr:ATP synthase F0 subunit 8 [Levensteiniella iris]